MYKYINCAIFLQFATILFLYFFLGKGNWKGTGHKDTSRSMSRVARDKSGVRDPETRQKLDTMKKKMQQKKFGLWGKAGESDRKIPTKMPKHLFAGKRGAGKTDRR